METYDLVIYHLPYFGRVTITPHICDYSNNSHHIC